MCREGAWRSSKRSNGLRFRRVERGGFLIVRIKRYPMSLYNIMDMTECTLCPRSCGVDREAGEVGYCKESAELYAARAALYFDEEPVISGRRGSGAVFFSGCNMGCVYCQNYAIAKAMYGSRVEPSRLADIFLELQAQDAENINLVTPSHYLNLIIPAIENAKRQGLSIPVVYNTGTYERVEAIKALGVLVDIWMPDFKYISPRISLAYSHTPDYFQYASKALAEMVRQCPRPLFADGSSSLDAEDDADDPVMVSGVIVRHLALPGCAEDSRDILDYLYSTYGDSIFISLLNQYTPMPQVMNDPNLGRKLTAEEYDALVDYAISIGITNGFIQDGETASQSYIPAFDGTGL